MDAEHVELLSFGLQAVEKLGRGNHVVRESFSSGSTGATVSLQLTSEKGRATKARLDHAHLIRRKVPDEREGLVRPPIQGNALAIPCVGCTSAQSTGLHALIAVGTFARRIEIKVKMISMGVI